MIIQAYFMINFCTIHSILQEKLYDKLQQSNTEFDVGKSVTVFELLVAAR